MIVLLILILFVVVTLVVLLYWIVASCFFTWRCEDLSNKAVLITGCDFNEVAREIALLLDKNGVPVFACFSSETNAQELRYDFAALLCFAVYGNLVVFVPPQSFYKKSIMPEWTNYY